MSRSIKYILSISIGLLIGLTFINLIGCAKYGATNWPGPYAPVPTPIPAPVPTPTPTPPTKPSCPAPPTVKTLSCYKGKELVLKVYTTGVIYYDCDDGIICK